MRISHDKCPEYMLEHTFFYEFQLSAVKKERIWQLLQRRETFTQGQIFPYRVEFASGKNEGVFRRLEKNIHHGPLLHLPGEIGVVTENYRSLYYYFGSYVISFRLIRPICLEFFKTERGIKLRIKSFVRPWFRLPWHWGNLIFWKNFGITFLFKR